MKKVWLIVAITALCGMAASTFAQVQNIRLSGDVRIRGYYLSDAGTGMPADPTDPTEVANQKTGSSQFIVQRTRVSVEADLADHVLAVVTLKAEGAWGQTSSDNAGRVWTVGVQEAYVQLRELFYSPATLKAGRQFLNYGSGLILSSANQNYTFDAGRLVLDYHPLVIDLVAGQISNPQSSPATTSMRGQSDLLFLNIKYESDSVVKTAEAYFGWMPQDGQAMVWDSTSSAYMGNNRTANPNNASPMVIGLRTDMAPVKGLTVSLDGTYELGNAAGEGSTVPGGQISAWLAKAAIKYTAEGSSLKPSVNASYTFASGGGADGRNTFLPWFDDIDGMNGYLFQPALANIQILNLGASVKPCANTSLAVQGFYYLQADRSVGIASNPNVDFGGPGFVFGKGNGAREVGWEIDTILGYDYSNDVRCQLVYAAFIPDHYFTNNDGTAGGAAHIVANEIRGEINVKF